MATQLRSIAVEELPTETARLPAAYQAATTALANCASIDECQSWVNKAQALASYARQADDDTLQKHAMRIQSRAVRRRINAKCGDRLDPEGDTGQPRLPGYHHVQQYYIVRRRNRDVGVPVHNMTDRENDQKIELYDSGARSWRTPTNCTRSRMIAASSVAARPDRHRHDRKVYASYIYLRLATSAVAKRVQRAGMRIGGYPLERTEARR